MTLTSKPKGVQTATPQVKVSAASVQAPRPSADGYKPPSWSTDVTAKQLETIIQKDMAHFLRQVAGNTMLDQVDYNRQYRQQPGRIPPQGKIFLDSLDHLPLSAALRKEALTAAIEGSTLPGGLRLEIATAAVQQRRASILMLKRVERAVEEQDASVGQVADFGEAVGHRLVDTVVSVYQLAKFGAETSTIRMVLDPVGYATTTSKATLTVTTTLKAMKENPRLLWDAMTQDVRDNWQQGKYGASLGYATFDIVSLGTGGTGAARSAAGTTEKMRVVVALAKDSSGKVVAQVSQMGDDVVRGMGMGQLNPALASVGGAAKDAKPAAKAAGMVAQNPKPLNPMHGAPAGSAAHTATSLADPATLSGLAKQTNLAQRCTNWAEVQPFIGKPAVEANLPPEYLYAKIPLRNGKFEVYAYLPESETGYVPKLKRDAAGHWQPDGLNWKKGKNGAYTVQRNYRLAKDTEYNANNPPPAGYEGQGAVNNHHLTPDEVMRSSPIFQELFRRGLISPDRAENMLNLAVSKKMLAELRKDGFTMSDILHYTQHPRYTEYVSNILSTKFTAARRSGGLPMDLTTADAGTLRQFIDDFDAMIRKHFFEDADKLKQFLRKNGSIGMQQPASEGTV